MLNLGFQERETWVSPHPKKGDPGYPHPKKGRSKKCANFHVTKRYDEMQNFKEWHKNCVKGITSSIDILLELQHTDTLKQIINDIMTKRNFTRCIGTTLLFFKIRKILFCFYALSSIKMRKRSWAGRKCYCFVTLVKATNIYQLKRPFDTR